MLRATITAAALVAAMACAGCTAEAPPTTSTGDGAQAGTPASDQQVSQVTFRVDGMT